MPDSDLNQRVAELEETVRRLEARVESLAAPRGPHRGPRPAPARRGHTVPKIPEQLKDARYWFRILGIGLLLLGTIFIFKYSEGESRGLMTLRVAIGIVMGLGLVGIGFRLRHSERHFASVLTGGGIGIWYITGFAAFQIFNIVGALPAFAFMTVVTVLAFLLSIRQNVVALAVIGAMGGLGTPWLLYEVDRALIGPIAYMCLVLAGAIAVYVRKGWKALLWSSAIMGGGGFLAIGARYYVDEALTPQRLTMQAGIAFYWLLFAVMAAVREAKVRLQTVEDAAPKPRAFIGDAELFVTLVAIYGVGMTTAIWEPNLNIGGWVGILTAAAYALCWYQLEKQAPLVPLARAHLLGALVLVTTGVSVLLDGEILLVTLAAEAAALHALSRHIHGRLLPVWGHLVYFVLAIIVLGRVAFDGRDGTAMINGDALAEFWIIASGVGASFVMRSNAERLSYRYAAHGLFLFWVLRQLHELPGGQGIVSVVWGAYAIALVVAGLKTQSTKLRVLGIITLVLTVLKLVIVDLEDVEAIWRVLLFSGFGAVLLFLSHWSQRYNKEQTDTNEDNPH